MIILVKLKGTKILVDNNSLSVIRPSYVVAYDLYAEMYMRAFPTCAQRSLYFIV